MVPHKFKKRNLKRFLMRNLLTFRNRAENRNSRPDPSLSSDITLGINIHISEIVSDLMDPMVSL